MLHSTFSLIVILLSSWAAANGVPIPPNDFGVPIEYGTPFGWPEYLKTIAHRAQNFIPQLGRRSPLYEWLFGPELDSEQLKRDHLQKYSSILDALRHRQAETGKAPPVPLEFSVRFELEIEFDAFMRTCIYTVVNMYENPPMDVGDLVRLCEEHFTLSWQEDGSEQVIKGVFDEVDFSGLQTILNGNYKRCIKKGKSEEHCKRQTEVTVSGRTIKAEIEPGPQMFSHGDFFKNIGRTYERYFSGPEQTGEKKPGAVFRDGARPRVPRVPRLRGY